MDFVDAQPEFTKAVWDYLDILVTDERLRAAAKYSARIARSSMRWRRPMASTVTSSRRSGASSSNYSTKAGDRPVLRSTATLACIGRRQAYFKDEFLSALEILHRGDLTPEQLKGSWAGAFGATQFMPTAFKKRDRRRRRRAARYRRFGGRHRRLHRQQVQKGRLAERRDLGLRGRSAAQLQLRPRRPVETRSPSGSSSASSRRGKPFPRSSDTPFLRCPAAPTVRIFLMLHNFRVIMRYNPAEASAGDRPLRRPAAWRRSPGAGLAARGAIP